MTGRSASPANEVSTASPPESVVTPRESNWRSSTSLSVPEGARSRSRSFIGSANETRRAACSKRGPEARSTASTKGSLDFRAVAAAAHNDGAT